MRAPSLDPKQKDVVKGIVNYLDEVDKREDRVAVKRICNSELSNLIHAIPAITLLRIVADYTKKNL